ncbi:MAG: methionine--tRNA ligase [Actinobacteria bacterium]|nr:MAG: methionine--tRNA ligase [Actinomycetota bacterium]
MYIIYAFLHRYCLGYTIKSMAKDAFYVTTPIYYVNDVPHIGHAYSTVAADVLARFNRCLGNNTFFLTGTDEHGQKVARAAAAKELTPKQHTDQMVKPFKDLWKRLNISYDRFIRTTDKDHEEMVQAIFNKLKEQGDIYAGHYEGWYCVHEETFYPESQLEDGNKCPECKREVEWVKEENYYFKVKKYLPGLLKLIKAGDFNILPQTRQNEVVSLIESGSLEDVSISRTGIKWGVPVPGDPEHVIYVWFDALLNYLSGIGYHPNNNKQKPTFNGYWPADVQIIGKDILKFHCIIWPAMLLALGLELPEMIFAHGFLTLGQEKISKSKGMVINPNDLIDKYGADAYRYFFLSEFTFGLDGEYTEETMIKKINSDLANDLGNLVHRTANMMQKYFDGVVPAEIKNGDNWFAMHIKHPENNAEAMKATLGQLWFRLALESIWGNVRILNKYIEDSAPWALKKEGREEELATVMYTLAEGIRIISQLIYPFMPETAQKIWEQIGMPGNVADEPFDNVAKWGLLKPDSTFKVSEPLFPRIEV